MNKCVNILRGNKCLTCVLCITSSPIDSARNAFNDDSTNGTISLTLLYKLVEAIFNPTSIAVCSNEFFISLLLVVDVE